MSVAVAAVLSSNPQVDFPGGEQAALMLMRWIHLVSGITWIGLLYFFNLVNAPFLSTLDAENRKVVVPNLMPKALWWFRWSSVVTVLVGIAYWMHIVVTDVNNAIAGGQQVSPARVFSSFFLIWTSAFVIEMGLLMSPLEVIKNVPSMVVLAGMVLLAGAWLFLSLNHQGWESNRALAIGIGGGLGWFMMLNVWGIVWRMQKKIIHWTEAAAKGAEMPAGAPRAARLSSLTARVNFWVSFPMLFFMGAASHYIMFVTH
jgi:uncharacterized membrane protein